MDFGHKTAEKWQAMYKFVHKDLFFAAPVPSSICDFLGESEK